MLHTISITHDKILIEGNRRDLRVLALMCDLIPYNRPPVGFISSEAGIDFHHPLDNTYCGMLFSMPLWSIPEGGNLADHWRLLVERRAVYVKVLDSLVH